MIQVTPFGTCNDREVSLITLSNGQLRAELLPYGASIRALYVIDRSGQQRDVCLGYDTMPEYLNNSVYMGTVVGRFGNRIADASFTLNGQVYTLNPNEGTNTLHGGIKGFSHKVWDFVCGDDPDDPSVTFTYVSPDGEEGFPGTLTATVTYALEGDTFVIRYGATSDADTVVNLTSHAYYNLGGHGSGRLDDHILTLNASRYTPVDSIAIPTGELAPVAGTPWDLTGGVRLGDRNVDPAFAATNGIDHNFVLDEGCDHAADLYCPESGIGLVLSTDRPGLQIYCGGFLTPHTGKGGAQYDLGYGMCMEPQTFPDAIHQPHFPSPILRKGETYGHTTRMRFYVK